jgi:hypothetical protein
MGLEVELARILESTIIMPSMEFSILNSYQPMLFRVALALGTLCEGSRPIWSGYILLVFLGWWSSEAAGAVKFITSVCGYPRSHH